MENTAIIELSESHAECIYSQVRFLIESNYKIHLILNEKLSDQTEYALPDINRFFIKNNFSLKERFKSYLYIRDYVRKNKITLIIFNTTTGRFVRELLYFLPANINYAGTIHDGRKLTGSSTQKAISKKVKKYFTLNDYVTKYLREKKVRDLSIDTFYPIFFPHLKLREITKSESEFWIVIPGKVEQKRRNYFSLIQQLEKNNIPKSVKFILLGPSKHFNGDGKIIESKIISAGIRENFVLFDDFVSDETYYSYLIKSDLIMPLVEPGNEFYETYKNSQITGAYNIAFGFGIPILFHKDLSHIDDLRNFGIPYNTESFCSVIKMLFSDKTILSELRDKILTCQKFQFDYQQNNYTRFLNNK